jgi:hypothetical protein
VNSVQNVDYIEEDNIVDFRRWTGWGDVEREIIKLLFF